jgi:hypothetical protein
MHVHRLAWPLLAVLLGCGRSVEPGVGELRLGPRVLPVNTSIPDTIFAYELLDGRYRLLPPQAIQFVSRRPDIATVSPTGVVRATGGTSGSTFIVGTWEQGSRRSIDSVEVFTPVWGSAGME